MYIIIVTVVVIVHHRCSTGVLIVIIMVLHVTVIGGGLHTHRNAYTSTARVCVIKVYRCHAIATWYVVTYRSYQ